MLLQLILFNPRLLQDVGDDVCFSIVIGGVASCHRAIEGAEVFGEDILNFF